MTRQPPAPVVRQAPIQGSALKATLGRPPTTRRRPCYEALVNWVPQRGIYGICFLMSPPMRRAIPTPCTAPPSAECVVVAPVRSGTVDRSRAFGSSP